LPGRTLGLDKEETTASEGNTPCLIVISGKNLGNKILLNRQTMRVGRASAAHISLNEGTVSKKHAEFHTKNKQTIVKDLQSKNGLYVNEVKVVGSILKDGDLIRIGTTVFKFLELDTVERSD